MSAVHENPFALDTVRFITKRTTDSNPFGDRDEVASQSVLKQKMVQPTIVSQTLQNEMLRDEVQSILAEQPVSNLQTSMPSTFSDTQLLINIKKFMLEGDPAHLINVLLFWINFQVSHGMPNHNQCVLNVLQNMKNLFVAQNNPSPAVLSSLNQVLCNLVQNLNNEDYDSTESIVDFVQLVGVYFMRDYLFERQVITHDLEAFDLLTTWICYTFIMKRQLPMGIGDLTIGSNASITAADMSKELLQCMQVFEQKVNVPAM